MNKDDDEQDSDSMRQAYQQFMMTGRMDSPSLTNLPVTTAADPTLKQTPTQEIIPNVQFKDYWRYIKSFQLSLQQEWMQVDDILLQLCESISNLRQRIHLESRHLAVQRERQDWKCYGYKHSIQPSITHDDVNMALNHDLMRHESMMSKLKSLMATLSQGQSALGRRFEQLLTFHMTNMEKVDAVLLIKEPSLKPLVVMDGYVSRFNHVLTALATELHRKQCLVQKLRNSCTDDLIYNNSDTSSNPQSKPRSTAEACVKDWPRGSSKSLVKPDWLSDIVALSQK